MKAPEKYLAANLDAKLKKTILCPVQKMPAKFEVKLRKIVNNELFYFC